MMRRFGTIVLCAALALLAACTQPIPEDAYVIGFYNVENLFDTVHDRGKNDQAFTPDGENAWTQDKYEKKLSNIASVIRAMSEKNGRWHTLLGLAEVENDAVLKDLVARGEIVEAGYRFVHEEGPDVRGIDCALLYRPSQFKVLETRTLPFDFKSKSGIVFEKTPQEQREFKTRDVLCVASSPGSRWPSTSATGLPATATRARTCAAAPPRSSMKTSWPWRSATRASTSS